MASEQRLICASSAIENGGPGVRFTVSHHGREEPAFVIRYDGQARAFLNRCGHTPMELDWVEGQFFDADGELLICGTHGALYAPDSGRCVGGRCQGKGLVPIGVIEEKGFVYVEQK